MRVAAFFLLAFLWFNAGLQWWLFTVAMLIGVIVEMMKMMSEKT